MEDFLFPWESKKQKKQTTKTNSANNSNNTNHRPSILPTPPPGQEWYQDKQTKEWKLIRSSLMTSDDNETPNNESSISTRSSLRVPPKSPASRTVILHNMPTDTSSRHHSNEEAEDDWDLVSENTDKNNKKPSITQQTSNNRVSASAAAGSVRSIDDISGAESVTSSVKRRLSEDDSSASVGLNPYHSTSNNTSSICSHTSSSIASSCQFLGPSGRGVLGVDYLEHVVLPTDTLPGICLAYKVHATKLRQANHFSGNSLLLAPKKLVIPISQKALKAGFLRVQDTDAKEYKLYSFLAEYSDFGVEEAKAYLEMSNWNLKDALQSAKEDVEWEHGVFVSDDDEDLKAGEIRIHRRGNNLNVKGAGFVVSRLVQSGMKQVEKLVSSSVVDATTTGSGKKEDNTAETKAVKTISTDDDKKDHQQTKKTVVYHSLPAIASKSALPQDLLEASPQHEAFGVELQDMMQHKKNKNPIRP